MKGGGAPKGAYWVRTLRVRQRADRRARAFRRSTADLLRRINASAQLQPRFLGFGVIGCHPHLPLVPVQPAPRRPVVITGRAVSGAARERVTSPPAGTAPAPSLGCHRSTSLRWADLPYVTITGTNVKDRLYTSDDGFDLMSLYASSLVALCRRSGKRERTGRRVHIAGTTIAACYACFAFLGCAVLAVPIDVIAKSHDAPRRIPRRCPACRNVKAHGRRCADNGNRQSQNGFHENSSVICALPGRSINPAAPPTIAVTEFHLTLQNK